LDLSGRNGTLLDLPVIIETEDSMTREVGVGAAAPRSSATRRTRERSMFPEIRRKTVLDMDRVI
jgi:hypothetical protein